MTARFGADASASTADDVGGEDVGPDRPASGARRVLAVLSQFAVMQVVLAGAGLVRNKVVAFRLGPASFGEFSQIASVVGVACSVVTFGMTVGLSRNAAAASSSEERRAQLASANGIVLSLAVAAVFAGAVLLGSGHLLPLAGIAQQPTTVLVATIFIAAIPFEGLKNNYLAFLQGILDIRGLATRRSAAVLLATVLAVPLVWVMGVVGAAVQFLLLSLFVAVMLGSRCRAIGYSPLRVRLDPRVVASLASFGLVSMISGFVQIFADTAVRAHLIATAGARTNGLLQAPYVLSELLKGVIVSSIGSVALATIAASHDRGQASRHIDQLLAVVVPVGASAIGLLGLVGAPLLAVLYSEPFTAGARFFPWILCADLLLVVLRVVAAPLLSYGDRALWLALDLMYAALQFGVAMLLMQRWGGTAVVVGYLVAIAIQLALVVSICRFRYELHVAPRHAYRLAIGLALVAALSLVGSVARTGGMALAGFGVWAIYTVHQARRADVLSMLRRIIQRT